MAQHQLASRLSVAARKGGRSHAARAKKLAKYAADASLGAGGTIGVIQPVEVAAEEEIQHWLVLGEQHGLRIVSTIAAPEVPGEEVIASDDEYVDATRSLLEQKADVIVLDCMAYTPHHRDLVAAASNGTPVLLAMQLTTEMVAHAYL